MTIPPSGTPSGPFSGLLLGRKRADVLAPALDGRLPAGVVPSGEVATLVRVATALRSVEPVQPRPEHTSGLRAALMEEAQTLLGPEMQRLRVPARPRGARERRLVAAAAAVLLIGGTASVATASQSALPGQALYPIKRGIEKAQTQIASTPAGKGRTLLSQAGDRLDEVAGLLADGPANGTQISGTLADFDAEAGDGAGLLLGAFRTDGDRSAARAVRVFAAQSLQRITALAGAAPESSRPAFATAAVNLRRLDARAARACDTCAAGLPALKVPGLLLSRAEVDRALHRAQSAPLDNSHPVVVPRHRTGQHQKSDGGASVVPKPESGAGTQNAPAPMQPSPSSGQQDGVPAPGPLPSLVPEPPVPPTDGTGGTGGLTGPLGGAVDGLGGTVDGLGGTVDGVGGAVGGLGDAVTTLLPDPGKPGKLLP